MIHYLSSPITSDTREKELENLERLALKKIELTAQGHKCFNPGELETAGKTWEYYLAKDLVWIYENKPTLYMMKNWELSRGCRLEHEMALQLNLTITYELLIDS